MRVQVSAGLCVNETDDVAVANITEVRRLWIIFSLATGRVEEPIVIGILVVVASDLLLGRAFGICLNVGVEEPTTVAHVLQGGAGANYNFKGRFFDVGASKIGLEEGAHLGITGARVLEDKEMGPEASHVDRSWDYNETDDAGNPVLRISDLWNRKPYPS